MFSNIFALLLFVEFESNNLIFLYLKCLFAAAAARISFLFLLDVSLTWVSILLKTLLILLVKYTFYIEKQMPQNYAENRKTTSD